MAYGNERAKEILRNYWDERLPLDQEAIAKRMSVTVIADPSLEFDDFGPLSGKFAYEQDVPVIRHNPGEPMVRQRFTIAHELGHFMLGHKDVYRDPKKNFSAHNFDPKEAACNRFAAELLMPETAIKHLIVRFDVDDIERMAKLFNVSEAAMSYRLGDLGWVS